MAPISQLTAELEREGVTAEIVNGYPHCRFFSGCIDFPRWLCLVGQVETCAPVGNRRFSPYQQTTRFRGAGPRPAGPAFSGSRRP